MMPASSVSALVFAHPDSEYFAVGTIGKDQVSEPCLRQDSQEVAARTREDSKRHGQEQGANKPPKDGRLRAMFKYHMCVHSKSQATRANADTPVIREALPCVVLTALGGSNQGWKQPRAVSWYFCLWRHVGFVYCLSWGKN